MKKNQLTRRTLLRGLGTAMALPWLEAMVPASPLIANVTRRVVAKPPVRMGFLYVPNGMHMPDWKPALRDRSKGGFEVPKILQPIAEFQDQMTMFSGLSLDGANAHGDGGGDHARSVASFLTGAHPRKTNGNNIQNGVSIDQVAARKIGHHTRLASLELGTEASAQAGRCDSGYSCLYTSNISWRTDTAPLSKEIDPRAVFNRLFGDGDSGESQQSQSYRERRRKSILDFVNEEAKTLQSKLGADDRRKLDEYLYAVRDIESRLDRVEKLGAVEQGVPDFPRPAGVPAEYGEHVKLLFDMMVLAFQTDSTRVISMMYANAGSNRPYKNLGITAGHHNLSHHGGSHPKQKQISEINTYHATLLNHLLTRLAAIKEGNGTLLDNCMLIYGSGIADGNSHAHKDLPVVMFGRGGGKVKPGRYIRSRVGTPLTNLYCSMLERAGAKVDSFSDSNGRIDLG